MSILVPKPKVAVVHERRGGTLILRDTLVPNGKQAAFIRACWDPQYKEILFHGAIRSGKSQIAGKVLLAMAMKYGGTYLIARSTYKELEDSTMPIMLKGDGGMPPVIPPELIASSRGRKLIYEGEQRKVVLVNGAEIRFRSLEPDNRGKIRNITYAGAMIDQVEELDDEENDEDFYDELLGRISDPNAPRKMLLVANPGPEDHWVCVRFGCTPESAPYRKPGTAAVHCSLLDNAHNLHPDYVAERLATEFTRPDYFQRMVMGQWGAFGGKRFKNFDRARSIVDKVFDVPKGWEIIEGADYGWKNPTHWSWAAVDYDERIWVVAEYRASQTKVRTMADEIKAIRRGEGLSFQASLEPSVTWLDPSAWRQVDQNKPPAMEFRDYGIYPAKANNERLGGWDRLDDYLTTMMPDGYSRLRFFPTIEHGLREIGGARIKAGTDDIEKKNDHALDGYRYILNGRTAAPKEEQLQTEGHEREDVVRRIYERMNHRKEQHAVYTGEAVLRSA